MTFDKNVHKFNKNGLILLKPALQHLYIHIFSYYGKQIENL